MYVCAPYVCLLLTEGRVGCLRSLRTEFTVLVTSIIAKPISRPWLGVMGGGEPREQTHSHLSSSSWSLTLCLFLPSLKPGHGWRGSPPAPPLALQIFSMSRGSRPQVRGSWGSRASTAPTRASLQDLSLPKIPCPNTLCLCEQ